MIAFTASKGDDRLAGGDGEITSKAGSGDDVVLGVTGTTPLRSKGDRQHFRRKGGLTCLPRIGDDVIAETMAMTSLAWIGDDINFAAMR